MGTLGWRIAAFLVGTLPYAIALARSGGQDPGMVVALMVAAVPLGAFAADRLGRNGLLWAFVGFVFAGMPFVVLAFLQPRPRQIAPPSPGPADPVAPGRAPSSLRSHNVDCRHHFALRSVDTPTWCDVCGESIGGASEGALLRWCESCGTVAHTWCANDA